MKINVFIIFLIFIFVVPSFVLGQQRDFSAETKDTSLQKVFYFHSSKTDYIVKELFRLDDDFSDIHYYDPILLPDNSIYQYLSLMGTPSQDLIYKTENILSYQLQPNNYKPYVFINNTLDSYSLFSAKVNAVKYFQNQQAYSAFSYSAGTDAQQYFDVVFAKNLYKGLNLQLDYNVNYADGNLANSQVMNQFFNLSLNYISPKGLYKNSAAFVHSRAYILENGGILADSLFINNDYSSMETYPTYLTGGWSKWKTNEFYFNQALRLSTKQDKNYGALVHSISYEKYARLYTDENKLQLDSLATTLQRNSIYWTNVTKKEILFPIHLGLNYDRITFADSLEKKHFDVFSPELRLCVKDYAELSYLRSFSNNIYNKDYNIAFAIHPPFNIVSTKFYFKANLQNKQADYIYSHYQTENLLWNNSTNKTKTLSFSLGLLFKEYLALEINYFDIKERYWFDTLCSLHSGNTSLYQINLKNHFSLKNFVFKGILSLQKVSNEDVLRVPLLALKQSVYYSFFLMKGKLPTHFGIDINYFTSFYADKYHTQTGMFVHQQETKIGNHLYADIFLSIKVQRFSIFASLIHLTSFIDRNYFNSPLYPHNSFAFRYGLRWQFLD